MIDEAFKVLPWFGKKEVPTPDEGLVMKISPELLATQWRQHSCQCNFMNFISNETIIILFNILHNYNLYKNK